MVAAAEALAFHVVDQPSQIDRSSWAYVSQNGSDDEVLEFLKRENIRRLDLSKIAFRMREKAFFQRAIDLIRQRLAFDPVLWSYAVLHHDPQAIREYLPHVGELTGGCGPASAARCW